MPKWGKGYKINKNLAEIPDEQGQTWLHRAFIIEDFETVKELVEAGVNINVQNNAGDTPLHYINYIDDLEMIEYLLLNGANIHIKNVAGETVFSHVTNIGNIKLNLVKTYGDWKSNEDCSDNFNNGIEVVKIGEGCP